VAAGRLGQHGRVVGQPGSTSGISRWSEQAVACLAAEGLNNNQVAARLYISTHTVAHHLRQAFPKLSITSRAELARIVTLSPATARTRQKGI
jgi:DNA-binding NarL/FixJ family response regulator